MDLSREKLQELYYQMLRIRKVELRIESLYHLDEMKTPIHLCIGQEAVAVGVCANLEREDYVSSNHRGHGHYLAKGGDLNGMIAELHCRDSGCSRGRGGSMHLVDTAVGLLGSSSIVGGGIPIGTGLALAVKMRKQGCVSVVFFGDGAADEGVLYESVNFAILKKLPVVFVYENNNFSVCSRTSDRRCGDIIFHATPSDHMFTSVVDGNSVIAVYDAARRAIERARADEGPSFIECRTYRIRGHAGSGDSPLGYRSREEISEWEGKCPLASFCSDLQSNGAMSKEEACQMEIRIDEEIDEAFRFAQESGLPGQDDLHHYLFHG
jgi:TPP-dependent pyruvate/acetoin dehydrogenase alpha subunit